MSKINFIESTQFHIDNTLKILPESVLPQSIKVEENLYYINGITTTKQKGDKNADIIKRYFGLESPPILIHNTTDGFVKDVGEATKDYLWGSNFVLTGKNNDAIPHELSITILAMIQAAKNKNVPIGIMASSQGSLITTNCLLAFGYLDNENKKYLKQNVRVCHVGAVVHKSITDLLHLMLNKYVTAVNPKDPVASVLGMHTLPGIALAKLALKPTLKFHNINYYLPVDNHVIKYYDKKTKLDKHEPFVKKDFFTNPILHADPNNVNHSSNKWLQPFLNMMMQG